VSQKDKLREKSHSSEQMAGKEKNHLSEKTSMRPPLKDKCATTELCGHADTQEGPSPKQNQCVKLELYPPHSLKHYLQ